MTDHQIVEGLRGDARLRRNTLEHIYKSNFIAIRSYVVANNGTNDDARDIFQEGVVTLYHNVERGKFMGASSVKTYLYSICRNQWLQKLRSRKGLQQVGLNNADGVVDPVADDSINVDELGRLMLQLKEECRKLLIAFYYERRSMAELAEIFNLGSDQAARNKKLRCMEHLTSLVKSRGTQIDHFLQ